MKASVLLVGPFSKRDRKDRVRWGGEREVGVCRRYLGRSRGIVRRVVFSYAIFRWIARVPHWLLLILSLSEQEQQEREIGSGWWLLRRRSLTSLNDDADWLLLLLIRLQFRLVTLR